MATSDNQVDEESQEISDESTADMSSSSAPVGESATPEPKGGSDAGPEISQPRSVDFFQQIVEEWIEKSDRIIPPGDRDLHPPYVMRNILFFSWLLSEQEGTINRQRLGRLIDPMDQGRASEVLRYQLQEFIYRDFEASVRFHDNALKGIERAFSNPKYDYKIKSHVDYFDDFVDGALLARSITNLEQAHSPSALLSTALRRALKDVDHKGPSRNWLNGGLDQRELKEVRLITSPYWKFILAAYPVDHALSSNDDVHKIASSIDSANHDFRKAGENTSSDTHALVVIPNAHNQAVFDMLRYRHENIHLIYTLSIIRFFNQLRRIVTGHEKEATQVFDAIFVGQGPAFSSVKAIDLLAEAIKKKSLIDTS